MKSSVALSSVHAFSESWELTLLAAGAFAVPFLIGQPQIAVGTAVNTALFLSVLLLPSSKRLAIITLPSLAVLLRGVIFGPQTLYLALFIPFIWTANYVLTIVFEIFNKRVGISIAVFLAAITKYVFLYAAARTAFQFNLVPQLFLTTMGSLQLVTALAGGSIAYIISLWLLKTKKSKR